MANRRSTGSPSQGPVGRSLLTSRAGILAFVLFGTFATLAIPVKQLLDQHARIAELQTQKSTNEALIKQLESEVTRWEDPAYVRAQARQRLHFVMPREVGYIVLEADEVSAVQQGTSTTKHSETAWYTTLGESLQQAGDTAPPLLKTVESNK